ncbi:hypothetical protein [Comamonas koreensis]|uniref:Uncharacterized protein n=1 Tax=Comamonas koreensis TaxID=160825 RepID=A0AAW4XZN1_9BURK|nr:hypothetical protein [Comamonas koreensis]MCD2166832.1 hypothetical protein [Comamonas koreensis]
MDTLITVSLAALGLSAVAAAVVMALRLAGMLGGAIVGRSMRNSGSTCAPLNAPTTLPTPEQQTALAEIERINAAVRRYDEAMAAKP